jgi:hypothetical protein
VSTETYATPTSGGATAVGEGQGRRTVKAPPRPRRSSPDWTPVEAAEVKAPHLRENGEPRLRQMVGVCLWAAVIGGIALITGIRVIIGSISSNPASWYLPWAIGVGTVCLALTVAAFLTVNKRWAPFALLGAATILMVVGVELTGHAF